MKELIKKDNPFTRKTMPRKDAIELFKKMGEDYKAEILSEIADDEVSVYEEGGFVDLCRGPTFRQPALSRHSSCSALPAHTGAEVKRTRCYSGYTELHLLMKSL